MVYFKKKENTMGQMKRLLDTIMELDESVYPDDLQMDYEIFLHNQTLLYEEKELSLDEIKTENHE